jgi:hypothetical protein
MFMSCITPEKKKKKKIALNQNKIYWLSQACFFQKSWTSSQNGTVVPDSKVGEINSVQVLTESAALENYFQHGFRQEANDDKLEESNESENGEDEQEAGAIDEDEDSQIVDNLRMHPALAWANKFILEM